MQIEFSNSGGFPADAIEKQVTRIYGTLSLKE